MPVVKKLNVDQAPLIGTFSWFAFYYYCFLQSSHFLRAAHDHLLAQRRLSAVLRKYVAVGIDWAMMMYQVGAIHGDEASIKMLSVGNYSGYIIPPQFRHLVRLSLQTTVVVSNAYDRS